MITAKTTSAMGVQKIKNVKIRAKTSLERKKSGCARSVLNSRRTWTKQNGSSYYHLVSFAKVAVNRRK